MSSAECLSCVKGSCGTQYSSYCSGNCGANASTSTCQNAALDIASCVSDHCSSECNTGSDGSAGADSGGASSGAGAGHSAGASQSSGGAGGAGTPTAPNCVKLEACCGTLPGEQVQGPCFQAAGFNNDGPCLNLLKSYQAAGQCIDGAGNETVACTIEDTCTKQTMSAAAAESFKGGCTMGGGAVSDTCPSDGVQGCCTVSSVEICAYADGKGLSEADCTQSGGKYTATP